jgi:transcriptional regulator with XRE-family HTH domain
MPTARERNDDAISFGLIMRRLRAQRGWTLQQVSQASGMNSRYLGSMERGGNVPSISTLILLSNVYSVDPAEILREMIEFRQTLTLRAAR